MTQRSTPINQLPSINYDENAQLVEDVLNEVEMSKNNIENNVQQLPYQNRLEQPYQQHQQSLQNYQFNPNIPFNNNNSNKLNDILELKEASFLGITLNDIKQMIILLFLFIIFNLKLVINIFGKYILISQDEEGFSTLSGLIIRGSIVMILFLILKKVL